MTQAPWPTRNQSTLRARGRRVRGERGATLVEMALSIGILMTVLIGIMEASLMVYSYYFISSAAREGTRYAIVRGSTWSQPPWNGGACASYNDAGCIASLPNVQDYVKSLAFPGIDPSHIHVYPAWYLSPSDPPNILYNAAGDIVQVKVEYDFPLSIPLIPQRTFTMSSTSEMVISQ